MHLRVNAAVPIEAFTLLSCKCICLSSYKKNRFENDQIMDPLPVVDQLSLLNYVQTLKRLLERKTS